MIAEEVKAALRKRHPALWPGVSGQPGQWTCLEEFERIDLLAVNAWSGEDFIGYEVKVSRSDYRSEILNPGKRAHGKLLCDEFYFAVPHDLLTPGELAYQEPEWEHRDFERERCPEGCRPGRYWLSGTKGYGAPAYGEGDRYWVDAQWIPCSTCNGKGHISPSRVEAEAPYLWVPRDVGLVIVRENGTTRCLRKSPRAKSRAEITRRMVCQMVRHASARPDPRHAEEPEVLEPEAMREGV